MRFSVVFCTMSKSSSRRRRRCSPNLSFILIILVFYSTVQCDTSHIFDFFKRTRTQSQQQQKQQSSPSQHVLSSTSSGSSSGSSSSGSPGVGRSDEGTARGEHHHDEQTVSYDGSPPPSTSTTQHHSSGYSDYTARGHSHGWGYGGHGDSNLDLYSLLGGLSFASLLGATIVFLARRSTTTTMVMNATGRRRRRDLDDLLEDEEDELIGKPLPEFMDKLVENLNHPWWWKDEKNVDKTHVVPFKLN